MHTKFYSVQNGSQIPLRPQYKSLTEKIRSVKTKAKWRSTRAGIPSLWAMNQYLLSDQQWH